MRPSGFELAAEAIKLACGLSMVGCRQGEDSGEGSIRCTKKRKAAALCIASSRVGEVVRYSMRSMLCPQRKDRRDTERA